MIRVVELYQREPGFNAWLFLCLAVAPTVGDDWADFIHVRIRPYLG